MKDYKSTWAGLKGMRRLPDVVVLVDQRRESNAVLEARKLDISLVSMLDTNCDPDLCEVPIPCNDDAVRSVQLILGIKLDVGILRCLSIYIVREMESILLIS